MEIKCTAVSRYDFNENDIPLSNKFEFTTKNNAVPDEIGKMIGRKYLKSGLIESFFKTDIKNGNISILEKAINEADLYEISSAVMGENELLDVHNLYAMYDVKESTKNIPTCLNGDIYGYPLNGSYKNTYEILLSTDGIYRRIKFEYQSVNISMYKMIETLEDLFEAGIKGTCEDETFNNLFSHGEDGSCICMYNKVGEKIEVGFENLSELLSFIASIRCIGSEFVEKNAKN